MRSMSPNRRSSSGRRWRTSTSTSHWRTRSTGTESTYETSTLDMDMCEREALRNTLAVVWQCCFMLFLTCFYCFPLRFINIELKSVKFEDSLFEDCTFEDIRSSDTLFENCTIRNTLFYNTGVALSQWLRWIRTNRVFFNHYMLDVEEYSQSRSKLTEMARVHSYYVRDTFSFHSTDRINRDNKPNSTQLNAFCKTLMVHKIKKSP